MAKNKTADFKKEQRDQRRRADDLFTWRVLGVMVFLAVWTFFFYSLEWASVFYALPAGAAIIYLLAYIYPRDFTALAVLVSAGALGLWLLTDSNQFSGRRITPALLCFGAGVAAAALLVWLLRRKRGVVCIGKRSVVIIPHKGRYLFLFTACAALAFGLAASILFGDTAAFISSITMFCYLFVAAVYYTVKLM
jgi:hypothetical protein